MRAIQQKRFGGPDVLELVEIDVPRAAADQVLIEVSRVGINFADVHARENKYLDEQSLPLVPGTEIAGVRVDTGERVLAFCATGGYAQFAVAAADRVFTIPDGVSDDDALALFVQGVTAHHLYATAAPPRPGDSVVVISGAGGTGSLLVSLAKSFGAGRVVATASSQDKRDIALAMGADEAIDGAPEGLADRIRQACGGGADVIMEPSGGAVFEQAIEALNPFGRLVVYGIASGEPNDLRTSRLLRESRTVAGFRLSHLLEQPAKVNEALESLFEQLLEGDLRPQIGGIYPLGDAAKAHTELRERRTAGKLLLDPHS